MSIEMEKQPYKRKIFKQTSFKSKKLCSLFRLDFSLDPPLSFDSFNELLDKMDKLVFDFMEGKTLKTIKEIMKERWPDVEDKDIEMIIKEGLKEQRKEFYG